MLLGEIPVYRVEDTSFWVRYLFIEWETRFWARYLFIEWETQVAG